MIDRGVGGRTTGSVDRYFLLAALIALGLALATAGRFFFINRLGERVVADLRERLYRHVLTLDQAFFLKIRTGEVLSRLTTDMTIVENMVGSSISVALRNALTFVAGFAWLIWLSPGFTGLALLVGVLVILPLFVVGRDRAPALGPRAGALRRGGGLRRRDPGRARHRAGVRPRGQRRGAASRRRWRRRSTPRWRGSRARTVMTALVMVLLFGGVGFVLWRAVLASFVDPHF